MEEQWKIVSLLVITIQWQQQQTLALWENCYSTSQKVELDLKLYIRQQRRPKHKSNLYKIENLKIITINSNRQLALPASKLDKMVTSCIMCRPVQGKIRIKDKLKFMALIPIFRKAMHNYIHRNTLQVKHHSWLANLHWKHIRIRFQLPILFSNRKMKDNRVETYHLHHCLLKLRNHQDHNRY